MHPNLKFRRADVARNLAFARQRSFGTLCLNAGDGPLMAHVPFFLNADDRTVDLHLVRSNPILALLETDMPAVFAIQGPDSYVSPDWYGVSDQVPTWNYVAVHLRGRLEKRPKEELRAVLDKLSANFEERLLPKPPWMASKMSPGVFSKMTRMIVPCRMTIDSIDGTWKLGQNKDEAVRLRAAKTIETSGIGAEVSDLARLMRAPE